jgi:hypothetical protein
MCQRVEGIEKQAAGIGCRSRRPEGSATELIPVVEHGIVPRFWSLMRRREPERYLLERLLEAREA